MKTGNALRRVRETLRWYGSFGGFLLGLAVACWAVGFFFGYENYLYPVAVLLFVLLVPYLLYTARAIADTQLNTVDGRLKHADALLKKELEKLIRANIEQLRSDTRSEALKKLDDNRVHMIRSVDGIRNDLLNILRSDRAIWRESSASTGARVHTLESRAEVCRTELDALHPRFERQESELQALRSALDEVSCSLERVRAQWDEAKRALDDGFSAIDRDKTSLRDTLESVRALTDSIVSDQTRDNAKLAARLTEIESRDVSIQSQLDAVLTDVEAIEDRYAATSRKHLSVFARSSGVRLPVNLILLVSMQRSGSTWLLDQLRTHPCIEMYPGYELYDALELRGRRYPGALRETPRRQSLAIEAQPNDGQLIVDTRCEAELVHRVEALDLPAYGIEKFHPVFFDYDVDNLTARIGTLEKTGVNVVVVYLVRDPKAAISSFLAYQRREPKWYRDLDNDAVMELYVNSYRCLQEMKAKRPGSVFDYSDLIGSTGVARSVFQQLWGQGYEELWSQVALQCEEQTRRDVRLEGSFGFLGENSGPTFGSQPQFSSLINGYSNEVDECERRYWDILGRSSVVSAN